MSSKIPANTHVDDGQGDLPPDVYVDDSDRLDVLVTAKGPTLHLTGGATGDRTFEVDADGYVRSVSPTDAHLIATYFVGDVVDEEPVE